MEFELTAEQREYRNRARAVATERVLPGYQERERAGRIEPELRRELGGLGLIASELPVELGGRGVTRLTSGLITEEIARGDINVAYLQVVGSLVGQILAGNATPAVAKPPPRVDRPQKRSPSGNRSRMRALPATGWQPPRPTAPSGFSAAWRRTAASVEATRATTPPSTAGRAVKSYLCRCSMRCR